MALNDFIKNMQPNKVTKFSGYNVFTFCLLITGKILGLLEVWSGEGGTWVGGSVSISVVSGNLIHFCCSVQGV